MNTTSPITMNTASPIKLLAIGCATAATVVSVSVSAFVAPSPARAEEHVRQETTAAIRHVSEDQDRPVRGLSPALLGVAQKVAELSNLEVWAQAEQVLAQLDKNLRASDLAGLPPLVASVREEDGSISIEWALSTRRLSITVEADPKDSAWAIVKANGNLACGPLAGTLDGVVNFFLA